MNYSLGVSHARSLKKYLSIYRLIYLKSYFQDSPNSLTRCLEGFHLVGAPGVNPVRAEHDRVLPAHGHPHHVVPLQQVFVALWPHGADGCSSCLGNPRFHIDFPRLVLGCIDANQSYQGCQTLFSRKPLRRNTTVTTEIVFLLYFLHSSIRPLMNKRANQPSG